MKLFCGNFAMFVVAVFSIAAADSSESDELEKFIMEQAKICQRELKATDKDFSELVDGTEPKTKIAKCLNACLMNKIGIMNEANKLVPSKLADTVIDDTILSKDGKPLKSVVKDVAEACKSVSDPDKCESAMKILSCLNAEAKKRGFDKNVF